jgi:hypothetical protein
VQASILLVSNDEVLSHTRSLILQQWGPVVVLPAVALEVIATKKWDLLILCQSVDDGVAASLAEQMNTLQPHAKVMAINKAGHVRNFHSLQYTVNIDDPNWLPAAVADILAA